MTAAVIAAFGIALYLPVAAAVLTWLTRRVDVAFARDMERVLRSRRGVGSEAADRSHPRCLSAAAGVERGVIPHSAAAPPAPYALAGAALNPSSAAPARPPRVAVHG